MLQVSSTYLPQKAPSSMLYHTSHVDSMATVRATSMHARTRYAYTVNLGPCASDKTVLEEEPDRLPIVPN